MTKLFDHMYNDVKEDTPYYARPKLFDAKKQFWGRQLIIAAERGRKSKSGGHTMSMGTKRVSHGYT